MPPVDESDALASISYRVVSDREEALLLARMPAFSVLWSRTGHIFVGGGGGNKGSGIPSGICVNRLDDSEMLEPIGFLDTESVIIYAMSLHPTKPILACAMNECTYIMEWGGEEIGLKVKRRFVSDFSSDDPFLTAVAISNNGKIVATGGDDSTVRLFDLESGQRLHEFSEHTKGIHSISFDLEDALIASSAAEDVCILWSIEPKQSRLWKLALKNKKNDSTLEFRGCTFSKTDAHILFVWMNDSVGSYVAKWDITTGNVMKKVFLDPHPAIQGHLSPDGSLLAVATICKNASLYIFDSDSLQLVGRHYGLHDLPMTALNFSPDASRLVTVSADMSYAIVKPHTSSRCGKLGVLFLLQLLILLGIALFLHLQPEWRSYNYFTS